MFFGSSCKIAMALFVLLITMGSLVAGATGAFYDVEPTNMQPCPFNQLCRCSRGGPEVGMVYCEDIPLGDVPNGINNTKSFAINLRRNGLRRIEEDLFHRTGKNRLETKQTHKKKPQKTPKLKIVSQIPMPETASSMHVEKKKLKGKNGNVNGNSFGCYIDPLIL